MADTAAKFAINLEDGTSGPAEQAAAALSKLRDQIAADQKALTALNGAMKRLQAGAVVDAEAYKSLAGQIAGRRSAIAGATADLVKLGGVLGRNAPRTAKASDSFDGFAAAAQAAQGRGRLLSFMVADLGKRARTHSDSWAGFGQAAQAALEAADAAKPKDLAPALDAASEASSRAIPKVGGLTGKLQKLSGDLGAGGIAFAALLAVTALGKLAATLGRLVIGSIVGMIGGAISAQEELEGMSQAAINVAKRTPVARSEVAQLSKELEKTGLKGAALERALEAGVAKKFGDAAKKSMLGFSVQIAKAKERLTLLFAGVNMKPAQQALAGLLEGLDESTASGRALKALIETMLDPLFGSGPAVGEALKQAFRGALIAVLKVGIAALTVRNQVRAMVAESGLSKWSVDWQLVGTAAIAVVGAVIVVGGVIAGLAAIVIGSVAAVGLFIGALTMLGLKAWEAGASLIGGIAKAVSTVWNYVSNFASMGLDFAAGLASGILSGLSSVISAAKQIAQGAVKSVKSTLGIASPARVMIEAGANTAAGFEQGIEAGTTGVAGASADLAGAAIPSGKGGAPAGRAGTVVTIGTLNVYGVDGADDPAFADKVADALGMALLTGGSQPA